MALNPYYPTSTAVTPFANDMWNMGGMSPFNNMNMMAPYQQTANALQDITRPMAPLMSADLTESDKEYNVHVDLPGVEDLDISIQDRVLTIKVCSV
jgi:HSP20 family molecular chaperone IbpA